MEKTILEARKIAGNLRNKYWSRVECEIHIAIAYLVLDDHDKAIETLEAASKMDGPIFLSRELDLCGLSSTLRFYSGQAGCGVILGLISCWRIDLDAVDDKPCRLKLTLSIYYVRIWR